MTKLKIKTKFQIGTACILLLFCALISILAYYYLKKNTTADIYKETEIFIGAADATRTYVKDVLRPTVGKLVPPDVFIPHAMSTSFVGREIMGRLKERFPEFQYKRAAGNPTNPINQADEFELSMLNWFDSNRDAKEWHGLIKKNNRSYYTRFRAIYAEKQCLRCHGKPEDAPQAMKTMYGSKGGYHYQIGEVVAADTIYIPVDVAFVRIKEAAWMVFLIAACSLLALLGLFYLLFNRTVVSELKGLLNTFRGISAETKQSTETAVSKTGDEFGEIRGAFKNVAHDLRQTHDELKASETKYRKLFETSRDAIMIFDNHTKLKDINDAGIKLFEFKDQKEALSIETFYQLFWDTRDAEVFHRNIQENGFIQGLEVPMVNRSGNKLSVMISATERRDDHGQIHGIDATMRDITEKKRLENYLVQTEKLASIGQLASGVAHEINNPLGVIKCYSNLIEKENSISPQIKSDIDIIHKHTDQCKSIVEALLNFARVSEPRKTITDIQECIEEVLSVLEQQMKKTGTTIHRDYMGDLPQITIDAPKIQQVIMNLLINSRQAISGQGEIIVKTGLDQKNNKLEIAISDSGTGIAAKHVDRIFDPFFTTKQAGKGTGLGLSVSYGIIKQHGGEIEVESTPGKGCRFTISLPLDPTDSKDEATHG